MPPKIRRQDSSMASESSNDESDGSSSRMSTCSSASSNSVKSLYGNFRTPCKQFWMNASMSRLSDLLGYVFKHGRVAPVAHITRIMYKSIVVCGVVSPFRGLLFLALQSESLNRKQYSDFTSCCLSTEPIIRNEALLEVLLILLQNRNLTLEMEPLITYAENNIITKESGNETSPVLAIYHGYLAIHHLREFEKHESEQQSIQSMGDLLNDSQNEFHEIIMDSLKTKIRQSLKSALCVPFVAGDIFLQLAQSYAKYDDDFPFESVLKTYINRNPTHLTGFLFYLQILRDRTDPDSQIRRLAMIRKILKNSPSDETALEYSGIILSLGQIADFQDVATKLAHYLDHWDRRKCLKGWILLLSAHIYARNCGKPVDIMQSRAFWFKYHFVLGPTGYDGTDIVKALFVSLISESSQYVTQLLDRARIEQDSRLEIALDYLKERQSFNHEQLQRIVRNV